MADAQQAATARKERVLKSSKVKGDKTLNPKPQQLGCSGLGFRGFGFGDGSSWMFKGSFKGFMKGFKGSFEGSFCRAPLQALSRNSVGVPP